MRKETILLLMLFLFCGTSSLFAQCVSGDCTNGKGIFKYSSGAKYVGEFVNGEIHGQGICYYSDGSKYEGQWNYRYPEGQGTKTYADDSTWKGLWKKGKPLDNSGAFLEETFISKGSVSAAAYDGTDIQSGCIYGNCEDGQGTFAYVDGSKYEGQFLKSKMDGWGTWYFVNGDKYIGSFMNDYAAGRGTLYKTNGTQVTGDWEEGEYIGNQFIEKGRVGCLEGDCRNGYGTLIYTNGHAKYIGTFAAGKPHGRGTCNFANKDRYKGEWNNGLFHGVGTLYMANGNAAKGLWQNGHFLGASPQEAPKPSKTVEAKPKPRPRSNPSAKPKVWAMIVGVAAYDHMPALKYTDDDAYRVLAFLKSPEGGALDDAQLRILVDEGATKARILQNMKDIFSQAGENDLVMLYFSGHGLQGSFLPIDFDGYENKLHHEEINTIFKNSKAKYKLCIADACHSGSLLAAKGSTSTQNMLTNYYRTLAQANAGTALIMSSKSEETSLESSGLRQGVFSHFLIRGLKGEADRNNDNIVNVQELYDFVGKRVYEYTGKRQSPIIKGDYDPNMTVGVR